MNCAAAPAVFSFLRDRVGNCIFDPRSPRDPCRMPLRVHGILRLTVGTAIGFCGSEPWHCLTREGPRGDCCPRLRLWGLHPSGWPVVPARLQFNCQRVWTALPVPTSLNFKYTISYSTLNVKGYRKFFSMYNPFIYNRLYSISEILQYFFCKNNIKFPYTRYGKRGKKRERLPQCIAQCGNLVPRLGVCTDAPQ